MLAQSPHGSDLNIDCANCHNPSGWTVNMSSIKFDHDSTDFELEGAHNSVDCRQCHTSLIFSEVDQACIFCHQDMHGQSVGGDCMRCHNADSWLVTEVSELHDENGFPLIGAHSSLSCVECHTDVSNLRFDRIGNDCINCHNDDYANTTNPNHQQANFSSDCIECHSPLGHDWSVEDINHDFFPLTLGHEISDCAQCHTTGNFTDASPECVSCHQDDHATTVNPDHELVNFSTDCASCHTTEPEWKPAVFSEHDGLYFPVYNGSHAGVWNECAECHTDPTNYATFDCLGCHVNPETDDGHTTVSGYVYESNACFACHPTGNAGEGFDHNTTNFPLTESHDGVSCVECHVNGYAGTPTNCDACHLPDFNASQNPDHNSLGLSTDCASCHTAAPDWQPATFDVHDDYHPLNGAHAAIANNCVDCHNGDYVNTPNTCAGCHQDDYDNATNPDHAQAQFSTDCASCHTENDWTSTTFDHDGQYFPIYSGSHNGQWSQCIECHTTPNDFTQFSCIACHTNPQITVDHDGVSGFFYQDDACLACHPTGEVTGFDHNATNFPLTGAHIGVDCIECHDVTYQGTPTNCDACHTTDFNNTSNPDHQSLGFSNDCASCHTTDPDWQPASFADHDNYYQLNGAHAAIANNCVDCHNGDYVNTPNTCVGCHQADFDNTSNPNHTQAQFNTDCATCHTETSWSPANFDHDGQYFPIYSGVHNGEWTSCTECHTNPANYAEVNCTNCHVNPQTDNQHPGVSGYVYNSSACIACHPNGDATNVFDHNTTNFPLTLSHDGVNCIECHSNGYVGTPTNCDACHMPDFNSSVNPDHHNLGLSTDCASCHTAAPDWQPATFPVHDNYYQLNGAHAAIANNCVDCHNGDYVNTPNTCVGCHQTDYNNTTNPNHAQAQFATDCASCHNETSWSPSTFDHDGQYFPIYSGAHNGQWTACVDCHTDPNNYALVSCTNCHLNPQTDNQHPGVAGYVYADDACLACHPTGDATNVFDHNTTNFPLTQAHDGVNCIDCHFNGYVGTPTNCDACHISDYNQSANPNHIVLGLPTDCATCHTVAPDWQPATFAVHDNYYQLNGVHAAIANNCVDCHNGDYVNTPNTCVGCHQTDYNNTSNPNHAQANFSTDCASCHNETNWAPATNFDHNTTNFPLTQAHTTVACIDCHANGYSGTPTNCDACHQGDYNASVNPNHQTLGLSNDCATCHTTAPDWQPADFPVHDNYYVLNGAHAAIANNCVDCHNGDYVNTPNTCVGCHQDDYNNTTNPNHVQSQFSTDCASCHSETAWTPANFDHNTTNFPLTQAHANVACIDCHANGYSGTPTNCDACHQTDYDNSVNPDHQSLGLSNDCATCHTTAPDWQPADFPVHDNYYVLEGAHAAIANNCVDCHNGDYVNTPNTCVGCHLTDYNNTTNPNHVQSQFPTNCAVCHNENSWIPSTFDHNNTNFPLTQAHINVDCIDCHANGYTGTPTNCDACHQADYNASVNPNHQTLGLSNDCATCHTAAPDWQPAAFPVHDNYYQLNGAHAAIANNCVDCHNGDYNNTPNTCVGCHLTDYNNTTNPNHQQAQFPHDCLMCHNESNWIPSTFDHNATNFPLTQSHANVNCIDCHSNGYVGTPTNCDACHQTDYDNSVNPDHQSLGLSNDCATCHTAAPDWQPATFAVHDNYYPLNGAHAAIANNCVDCHNGDYQNTPTSCVGCHLTDYNNTTNPNHQQSQFSTDCASCHTENSWVPATFDHNTTNFPLTQAHTTVACIDCHANGYSGTPTNCDACHQADYNASVNPNHQNLGLSNDCAICHTAAPDWQPADFPVHDNYYVLEGAHAAIANNCVDCHNGDYNNTPNTCVGCHQDDFNNTTNPNHAQANFSTDCASCHDQNTWIPASNFDHNTTNFPLTQAHTTVACVDCHTNGYTGTPTNCDACHQTDYNATLNPNHNNLGLSNDCAMCHTAAPDWQPADFPVHDNYYQLNGAHAAIANNCVDCHNGDYNNTPNTCVGCHLADYNSTTNPNHQQAQFNTDCATCHTENSWSPSIFDHDGQYFPIYSGAHNGQWNDCIECHTNPNNYADVSCLGCHLQSPTNSQHIVVNGYVYQSSACIACHPTGDANNVFDHNTTSFPLTQSHNGVNCIECHANGYVGTPTNCDACHMPDFNSSVNPNHNNLGLSNDCAMCHTAAPDWQPAAFPVHNNYYPLNGAHALVANNCAMCHNGDYNNTPNTCVGCHLNDYNSTTNPNHAQAQFPTDCAVCHSENQWVPANFDHDGQYFPIYSNTHQGKWSDCTDCHANPNNYADFTCFTCHGQSSTNNDHSQVNGYVYQSQACLQCHPTGN